VTALVFEQFEAKVRLARIGYDGVLGALADPVKAFVERPDLVEQSSRLCAHDLVFCTGGYRSVIAASTLRALGFADVSDLLGGFGAWRTAGLPVGGTGKPSTNEQGQEHA
jgi:hypothetical protein